MSFLRRSRDAKAANISTPLTNGNAILSKPTSAKNFIPDKVIRAIEPRRAQAPQELSFSKGDFFFVTRELEYQSAPWFEVQNPNVGSRGLVPQNAFEQLGKYATTPKTPSFPMGPMTPGPMSPPAPRLPSTAPAGPKHVAFFAIVQYDFAAERPDELDAKAGEAISVVAQSNREWFVAKPIGRLGGPGLIPVSFVELREPQSGRKMTEAEVNECMDKGTLPKVEVWKKATMDYKQSSIPLGVIDPTPSPAFASTHIDDSFGTRHNARSHSSGGNYNDARSPDDGPPEEDEILPPGIPVQASIPSFHQESGEYWFRLDVRYQPDPDDEYSETLPRQIAMVLYRNYDDFYAFQLDLLDTWPVEAGREKRDPDGPELTESDRILPYMPGPVDLVNEAVTVERRADLDIYVHDLVALGDPATGADHVLRCELVRRFFARKPGDVELPPPSPSGPPSIRREVEDPNRLRMNGLSVHDDSDQRMSRASAYSDHKSQRSMRSYGNHNTRGSVSSYDGAPQLSPTQSAPYSAGHGRSPTASSDALNHAVSVDAARGSSGGGGGAGPTSQFLKVKIFHSTSDDLIAIRVSPRITHNQLLEKVRDRLGSEITQLRYSVNGSFGGGREKEMFTIQDDEDMREWVANNSKLVLYAY